MSQRALFCVAVEAIVEKRGKILVTQRSFKREHAPGQWEIITGHVEPGETFEEAATREVKEEVDLEVEVIKPINTFHFYYGPNRQEHQGISLLCRFLKGEVKLDLEEQVNFKWLDPLAALEIINDPSIQNSLIKASEEIKRLT